MPERSCVVCTEPTDTALGLVGDAEYILEALTALTPPERAALLLQEATAAPQSTAPRGRLQITVPAHAECAKPWWVGKLGGPIPTLKQRQ